MADIVFYGKPNCINNKKQKALLEAAGHDVVDRDILSQNWQPEQLKSFFGQAPVAEWFNMTAPAVKSGTVLVDKMSSQEALEAMVSDPLLIRRPLMEVQGQKVCGFRYEELDAMIGLSPIPGHERNMQVLRSENITTCPFLAETVENCDERKIL